MKRKESLQQARRRMRWLCGFIIGVGLFFMFFERSNLGDWLAAGGLLLFGLSVLFPRMCLSLSMGWTAMKVWLLTHSFTAGLFLVFVCVVTPLALCRRLSGKDDLARSFDSKCSTYRIYRAFESDLRRQF